MNALVGYGSSDEEEEKEDNQVDVPSERPAKVAKTNANANASASANFNGATTPNATAPQPAAQHSPGAAYTSPATAIVSSGPAPGSGPAATPASVTATATASASAPAAATAVEHSQDPPSSPYIFERQRVRELTMPTTANFDIPDSPAPPERNSEDAAELAAATKKFERFLELKAQGVHFNDRLQNSSSLRNPALLSKLLAFAGVSHEESCSSSLPAELAVPAVWPEDCYVENLLKQNERKEKKRLQERDRLDFVPSKSKT